jgi:hypothetical protein
VDTSNPRVRTRFEQEVAARRRKRDEIFAGAGVQPVEIRLDGDTIAPLVGYFRRRERWRAAGH